MVDFGVTGFDLPDLAAHHDEVVENFVNEAKRLNQTRRGSDYSNGHQPMSRAHKTGLASGTTRRSRSRGHRRADPHGGPARRSRTQAKPRALAKVAELDGFMKFNVP